MSAVGSSVPRRDAAGKVDGSTRYAGDAVPDNALHAVVVFSGKAHARMLSMSTDAARATAGVVDVITAADAPVNEYGLTMRDQPALVGVDHSGAAAVDGAISRWEADQIAVVVGETIDAARAGAAALEVEWEDLPIVADIDAALASGPAGPPRERARHQRLPPPSNPQGRSRLRLRLGLRRRRRGVRGSASGTRLPST